MPPATEMLGQHPSLGLRQRLLLAILAPLTLVFSASVFLDYRLAKQTADAAFDQSLADAVLDIAAHIQSSGPQLSVVLSAEAEAMLRSDASDQIYFAVRDDAGRQTRRRCRFTRAAGHLAEPAGVQGQPLPRSLDTAVVQRISSPRGEITIAVAETLSKRNRASRRS